MDIVINNINSGEDTNKKKSKNKIVNTVIMVAVALLLTLVFASYIKSPNYAGTVTDTSYVKQTQCDYILNTNTMKAHKPNCKYVDNIDDENRKDYCGTAEELQDRGYTPCKHCQAW